MTCIVALKNGKEIYMGADSQASNNRTKHNIKQSKIFINGEMIFGCCGSPRMSQILEHDMVAPERPENISDIKYLVSHYIPALIETFNNLNYIGEKFEDDHIDLKRGGSFLLGYKGNIYSIQSDFQVGNYDYNYIADGSGEEVALGSLYTSEKLGLKDPKKIITLALEASSNFSRGVGGPFNILKI